MRAPYPYALFAATALLAHNAMAADIDFKGAEALQKSLTAYLPEDLVKNGLVTVRPGTTAYEVRFDPTVLLRSVDAKTLTISGLKPFLSLVTPLEQGLWKVTQSDRLDINGTFTAQNQTNTFSYRIGDMRMDGVFDPDIRYFQSADMSARDITMSSKSAQSMLDARFKDMTSTISSTKTAAGTIDVRSETSMNGYFQSMTDPNKVRVDISADDLDVNVAMNGLAYRPLIDLVFFVLDNMDRDRLDPAGAQRLKTLALANIPLFDTLLESITLNNLNVITAQGTFGAKAVNYTIDMNGISKATRIGFGIDVTEPRLPMGLLPAEFMPAVPDFVEMRMSVPDINLADGLTYVIENSDFSKEPPLDPAKGEIASRIFFPDGTFTVTYDNVAVKSEIYDLSMTGTMMIFPGEPQRQNTDVTLYARDFDKTVAYLQENAKTVPQFGQAAFGMLMLKGFAKTAPDGRLMWNVAVDEAGKVKINGQEMNFPR